MNSSASSLEPSLSFFHRPRTKVEILTCGTGVPLGIERVTHPDLGIGGAFGTWGEPYDNDHLPGLIEDRLGVSIPAAERMNLSELGFLYRHHSPVLSKEDQVNLEVEVGSRLLRAAAEANGWAPADVEAVLLGTSAPITEDYTERICRQAGISEQATKISVHKACDGSVGSLHLALNPDLDIQSRLPQNLAKALRGKRVLIGGIEGLSRFLQMTRDLNAWQLFGNGAGVIGVIPGKTMKFLAGRTREVFDEEGVLKVRMLYPHSGRAEESQSKIDISSQGSHYRLAGLMHEPTAGTSVDMAGLMGMVKLFVRTGVEVVRDVYADYKAQMARINRNDQSIAFAIVHHANLKINKLKEKHLEKEGIQLKMPWLLSDFGNISAASNMIAFLRQLPQFKSGDHILIDGFGAGTYYDVLAVELSPAV